jgi:outer membrane cobalamin receptor
MNAGIPQTIDVCFNTSDGRECYSITAYERGVNDFIASCDCEHIEQCGEVCDGYQSYTTDDITQAHAMGLESILSSIMHDVEVGNRDPFEWERWG